MTLGTLLEPDANLSPARRRFYRMLDVIGLVLLIAGVIVSITGGRRYEFPFLTLSLRLPSGPPCATQKDSCVAAKTLATRSPRRLARAVMSGSSIPTPLRS